MTLLSPFWLALLVPWAAAWVWTGRSTRAAAGVPFLRLWPASPPARAPRRRRPPGWAVVLWVASLSAILATAGPAWTTAAATITVVVDRTPSMTPARVRSAFGALGLSASTRVRVVPVPGEAFESTAGAFDAGRVRPTAVAAPRTEPGQSTPAEDGIAVRTAAVREAAGVVLTDRSVDLPPGAVRVSPPRPLVNAGIDRFVVVAGDGGRGRAMVRVFNGSRRTRGRIRVAAISNIADDGRAARQRRLPPPVVPRTLSRPDQEGEPQAVRLDVDLPATGTSRDYFLDLLSLGDACVATLSAADGSAWVDDVPGDDAAFVARVVSPGPVVPRAGVSDALGRMLAVYAARRPAAADAGGVAVVRGDPGDGPAVVLASATSAASDGGRAVTVDPTHPASRSLTPAAFDGIDPSAGGPAGDGWRVLARAGDVPLLAVRETPARQAWVGFDADAWASSPAYVVFWADLLDWAGGGAAAWDAAACRDGNSPLRLADATLAASPGLYADAAGKVVATAMDAVRPSPAASGGAASAGVGVAVVALSPGLALAAIVLCGLGVAWRNLTESRSGR